MLSRIQMAIFVLVRKAKILLLMWFIDINSAEKGAVVIFRGEFHRCSLESLLILL